MSEESKPCRLEEFVGQKVRVKHERFSGIGILKRVDPAREAIAWVQLQHGEDRWYEASTVLPLQYSRIPVECQPDERRYTEDQIIDVFWKTFEDLKLSSGLGNSIIYGMLETLKRL